MVHQIVDGAVALTRVLCLHCAQDTFMQSPPVAAKQRVIGDGLRQCMRETVNDACPQVDLDQEPGGPQSRDLLRQGRLVHVGNGGEQGQWNVTANDGGDLQDASVERRQPVDARRQYGLHRSRNDDVRQARCTTGDGS